MENQKNSIPFGLLFEELAPQPETLYVPIYDESTDVSYIEDTQGRRIACVEYHATAENNQLAGTMTVTETAVEATDTDPEQDRPLGFEHGNHLAGTMTVTKTATEPTDNDPSDFKRHGIYAMEGRT